MIKDKLHKNSIKGFLFSVEEAAIKKPGRKDIALIYSETKANIAGVFTKNKVLAAPVKLDMKKIESNEGQAIVVNSGNANACTGKQGMKDACRIADIIAAKIKIKPSLVYIASTGVIGIPLPMGKIQSVLPKLTNGLGQATFDDVASAIMTTDTFPKIISKKLKIDGKIGIIAGICKGAGMICPDMATMLCFMITDIAVEKKTLSAALKDSVNKSFNRITIDGDMSTNDTVLIMANGMIGNKEITKNSPVYKTFKKSLDEITYELSKLVVKDGEGATKLVEIEVKGLSNEKEAETAAFSIANSNLVKTAVYGNDANWGRIMAAIGYSEIAFDENKVDIFIGNVKVASKGISTNKDKLAEKYLKNNNEIKLIVNLNKGRASAKVLTCDLTEEYIKVNASYRT
ncbi:MAG: bifunctional glutamate N-acetyltransferase/amino-acid acetyltransferase ArgJ [Nitrospiraceae bacterium]|nr:bifunctional glutamate N-acetyltransferase/amino-acid acetyltransferase ArgJ [Nitrospiraceae bacterium]